MPFSSQLEIFFDQLISNNGQLILRGSLLIFSFRLITFPIHPCYPGVFTCGILAFALLNQIG